MSSTWILILSLAGAPAAPVAAANQTSATAGSFSSPVASFVNADEVTGARIAAVLAQAGIDSISYGSIGATVAVSDGDAARARELLSRAVNSRHLDATVLAADGTVLAPLPGPRPPPAAGTPAPDSRK